MNPILIELKQKKPGFNRFIGSWFLRSRKNILIDVGPSNSIGQLIRSLTEMGVDRVDYVLLTHIHIDHAGGLSLLLEHFPMARVVCHAKAISHLVDPTKLWAGTRKTLGGDLTDAYGPIGPVNIERLVAHTEARREGLEIVETPGHAVHHLSYIVDGFIFAGESGGVHFEAGDSEHLRPATPPVFHMKEFMESIDRLLSYETMPICYAHFGLAESSRVLLERHKRQLLRWERIIKEEISRGEAGLEERCLDALVRKDPELKAFGTMSEENQERERYFMRNSIAGYIGFLSPQPESS